MFIVCLNPCTPSVCATVQCFSVKVELKCHYLVHSDFKQFCCFYVVNKIDVVRHIKK